MLRTGLSRPVVDIECFGNETKLNECSTRFGVCSDQTSAAAAVACRGNDMIQGGTTPWSSLQLSL